VWVLLLLWLLHLQALQLLLAWQLLLRGTAAHAAAPAVVLLLPTAQELGPVT
jgi:hypothetical protein